MCEMRYIAGKFMMINKMIYSESIYWPFNWKIFIRSHGLRSYVCVVWVALASNFQFCTRCKYIAIVVAVVAGGAVAVLRMQHFSTSIGSSLDGRHNAMAILYAYFMCI